MKFGIWADELHRQYERLENAQKNVCVAMMDGAVNLEKALLILFSEPTWFNGRRTIRDCSAKACRMD